MKKIPKLRPLGMRVYETCLINTVLQCSCYSYIWYPVWWIIHCLDPAGTDFHPSLQHNSNTVHSVQKILLKQKFQNIWINTLNKPSELLEWENVLGGVKKHRRKWCRVERRRLPSLIHRQRQVVVAVDLWMVVIDVRLFAVELSVLYWALLTHKDVPFNTHLSSWPLKPFTWLHKRSVFCVGLYEKVSQVEVKKPETLWWLLLECATLIAPQLVQIWFQAMFSSISPNYPSDNSSFAAQQ